MKKSNNNGRNDMRVVRHNRLRMTLSGTAARPRLCVFCSNKHTYAQVIDDTDSRTVACASTLDKALKPELAAGCNVSAARAIGRAIAERALAHGINTVVFDRGGHAYHGRVKALADAAREGGLVF